MKTKKSLGWMEIALGVLLVILGVLTILDPSSALITFVIVYAIAAIVSGIVDIVFYARLNRRTGFAPVLMLLSGILSVIVGIMLFFNISAGTVALSILFPIWFIIHCISRLANLNVVKLTSGKTAFWILMIVNILGLVLGILLLFNLGLSAATLVYFVAFYLLLLGFGGIVWGIDALASGKREK